MKTFLLVSLSLFFSFQARAKNYYLIKDSEKLVLGVENYLTQHIRDELIAHEQVDQASESAFEKLELIVRLVNSKQSETLQEFSKTIAQIEFDRLFQNDALVLPPHLMKLVRKRDQLRRELIDLFHDNPVELYSIPEIFSDLPGEGESDKRPKGFDPSGRGGSDGVVFPSLPRTELMPEKIILNEKKISARVKLLFKGLEVGAGPVLQFKNRFMVRTKIYAAGNEPIIKNDNGVIYINHSSERRAVFFCDVQSQASTGVKLEGSLSFMGAGAEVNVQQWESLNVSKSSALKYVPYLMKNGYRTTLKDLVDYCSITFRQLIQEQINLELKLLIKTLRYSNREYQCATSADCFNWHNHDVLWWIRQATVADCYTMKREQEPVNKCRLLSKLNMNCPYYEGNKRITRGSFEYPCAKGLKCVLTKRPTWYRKGEARCKK